MTGLTSYLQAVQQVFSTLLSMIGDVLQFVLANPVLAIPTAIAILFLVIRVVKSFITGH